LTVVTDKSCDASDVGKASNVGFGKILHL
jgi:hypothetical protein